MEQPLVSKFKPAKVVRRLGAGAVVFAFLNLPTQADKIDFRLIAQPIALKLHQFSLPLAALEDDHLDLSAEAEPQQIHQIAALASGKPFQINLIESPQPLEWAVVEAPKTQGPVLVLTESDAAEISEPRTLQLKPLVLSKTDVNVAKLLPVQVPSELKPARLLAHHSVKPSAPTVKASAEPPRVMPEMRRLSDLGYEELADHLVRTEQAWRSKQAQPKSADAKGRVYVGLPQAAGQTEELRKQVIAGQTGSQPIFVSKDVLSDTTQPDSNRTTRPDNRAAAVVSEDEPSHRISGSFEFVEGLALTSPNQSVVIQRYKDGAPVEQGQVQLSQGRFEMGVRDLEGQLIAKLIDETGEVIGRGEQPVSSKPHIQMRLVEGVRGQVISAYSFGRSPIPEPDAYVTIDSTSSEMVTERRGDRKGFFEDPSILPGSSFVARAEKSGFWGTLAMGSSEEALTIPLFPVSMIEALIKDSGVRDQELALRKGVIWGRVMRDGKPVAGAEVRLDGFNNYKTLYFFSRVLLMDPNRTTTSENGYFAVVHVDPGLRAVQVTLPGEAESVQNILADNRFVSPVHFELSQARSAVVQVSDAFRFEQKLPSYVRWNDSSDIFNVDPAQEPLTLGPAFGSALRFLEVDAGPEYYPTRQAFSPSAPVLHSTPVKAEWIQKTSEQAGIRLDPQQGLIFGLIDGPQFEALMDDTISYSNANRVYFNQKGEITPTGPAGGGFVFFNVPKGLRTIGVQTEGAHRYGLRAVAVEAGQVNVIHYQASLH